MSPVTSGLGPENYFKSLVQARSQDLEKGGGGLFWNSEKCANDLDSNFHWPWISFRRFVRNLRRNVSEIQRFFPPKIRWSPKKKKRSSPKFRVIFRPKSKIQRFFSAQNLVISKKKKGLRQNSEWCFGRNPKFKDFFRPKLGDLQKKKVFAKIQGDFSSNFASSNVWGGLFSFFHRKSASKAQKTCDFAYFTSQWGGSSPPRPPLATLLVWCKKRSYSKTTHVRQKIFHMVICRNL